MTQLKRYGSTRNLVRRQRTFRAQPGDKGRKRTDAHNQGMVLKMGEIAQCPYPCCGWTGQRRELGAHWKKEHTR